MTCNCIIFLVAVYSFRNYPEEWMFNGVIAGNIYIQFGFLTHDVLHRLTHTEVKTCYKWAIFTSNVGFGVNAKWWRREHDIHHAAPNTWDKINGTVYDPQAYEDVIFC